MTVEISFFVESSDSTIPLGFEAQLNGQTQFSTDHVQQHTINISIDNQVETNHTLQLILKNKLPEHTTVSESGEIVNDVVLKITNILFDQMPVDQIVFEQAQYTHNFNGTANMSQDKFFGIMGCNGTVSLNFSTPIYLWLLENM
jgi:hypothetical protein